MTNMVFYHGTGEIGRTRSTTIAMMTSPSGAAAIATPQRSNAIAPASAPVAYARYSEERRITA